MKRTNFTSIATFSLLLVAILSLVFYAHEEVLQATGLNSESSFKGIIKSYLFNGLITTVVFSILILLKEKFMGSLGFFFLGGSLIKLILFFLLFGPVYAEDGVTSKLEFAEFFIPYGLCLFFEVFYLVKILMKEE